MRIGCLQFAPQVGDIDNNLSRADAVLSKASPENLDLLVLPELAFTGYNFKSLQEISPFLEPRGSGISALWARTVALKLNCIVTVGYPEKEDVKPKWPTSPEYYNSVIVVNAEGETVANYRKNFLYYTDETWALEGQDGFYGGSIPRLGTTSMGICMDINPYKFEAPWHAFEFAFHCLEVEANLVIVTMAWLTREDASLFSSMPNEPDMDTLTYWMARLEPIIRSENQEEIIVVFCNRTGVEGDSVYAGTSTVIGIKDGEVNVYGLLGRGEKELLVVDTEKPPTAKLVYSPDGQGSATAPILESPSSPKETWQRDNDQTTTAKLPSTQPSSKNSPRRTTESNAAQDKALLEEARFIGQPHSLVSQESHSSYQSYSNKRSHSSYQLRFSQNPESGRGSQSSHARQEATPLGVTEDYRLAPLALTRAQRHGNAISMQGSVSSGASSQCRSYQGVPRIQISSLPVETDTIPTSTQPSPTSLAVCPKSGIPKNAGKLPAVPYTPNARSSVGIRGRNVRAHSMHVSTQEQNEVIASTAAFDDLVPQSSNAFFWAPSDSLLRVPMEPRPWTPARADSPTLSMEILAISQA
ncbi:carbon-nitrogen hydrolase [Ustulina deusta]|nr:carbon-nitrogen hydrolase [Ustulina deusta]